MAAGKYTNASQQRLLRLLLALFSDVVNGVQPAVLAREVGTPAPNITRDLDNLATAGLARRVEETGAWCLTPRLPQQAIKVWAAISNAELRLAEAKQRFNVG